MRDSLVAVSFALALAVALALAPVACKPGHHPPPPEVPEPLDEPESKPPGVHDDKLFDGDDGGITDKSPGSPWRPRTASAL